MDDDKNFDYKLDFDEEISVQNKWPKSAKILLGIFICLTILIIGGALAVFFIFDKKLREKSNNQQSQSLNPTPTPTLNFDNYEFFGTIESNLTYDVNGKIENSFKKDGDNYHDEIGNLNNGKNYDKNDRNIYDLYIPQFALERKKETNGIILWIHGGAWIKGDKEANDKYCKLFSTQGYITATVGYTLLIDEYKKFNIYRILDEITACIKAIKLKLKEKGFDENKLLLSIGGFSAGGHLSLLYSYLIKKFDIIPLKFIINFVGPIGMSKKEYFLGLTSLNNSLSNIEELSTIEEAYKNGTLKPIPNDEFRLSFMNRFMGNKSTTKELESILLPNKTINASDERYKELIKFSKYANILEIEDINKFPTICFYGGIDEVVGVSAFAYLKQKMLKDKRPYTFFYSRYEGHKLSQPKSKDVLPNTWERNSIIMQYLKKYFGY